MTDIVDKATRSRMMAGIRSKDTRPELLLRKALHAAGLRYRLHVRTLPGKPDLVFPKYQAVVFVHGCFWHGHNQCARFRLPLSNTAFWEEKIKGNISRDFKNKKLLETMGWNVFVIWECEITKKTIHTLADKLSKDIRILKHSLPKCVD